MPTGSMLLRALAVAAFGVAPVAALETTPLANPSIATGDALAEGPGIGADNTGGNIEISSGEVVQGPQLLIVPRAPELAVPSAKGLAPVMPVDPAAEHVARAKALVDAAKAHAQALIDAARAQSEAAVQHAHDDAAAAQARSQAQTDAARARSDAAAAQAHS